MLVEFEKDLKGIQDNEKRIQKHLKSKNCSKNILKKYLRKLINMMQKLNYLITLNILDIRF
jgi:hypothetical protein